MMERPCNGLESIFVLANIRFVFGLSFPPQAQEERVVASLQNAIARVNCGISSTKPPTLAKWNDRPISIQIQDSSFSLSETLYRNVRTEAPTEGAGSYTLYRNNCGDITMAVWNVNHALMDAITVQELIKEFFQRLLTKESASEEWTKGKFSMENWLEPVRESLQTLPTAEHDPPYLPYGEVPPVKLSDIIGIKKGSKQEVQDDVVMVLPKETVEKCVTLARKYKTTLTGLWMACWVRAIAEVYYCSGSSMISLCCVAVSVLVDLRPFLPKDKNLLQTQATVTVTTRLAKMDVTDVTKSYEIAEQIWQLASAMKQDLNHRINRGEGHRKAMAMAEGIFEDEYSTPATLELSNHGIYSAPDDCHVELSQRFDDYEGLSVIVHTESQSGLSRGTASFGKDLDPSEVQDLVSRIHELIKIVAATTE